MTIKPIDSTHSEIINLENQITKDYYYVQYRILQVLKMNLDVFELQRDKEILTLNAEIDEIKRNGLASQEPKKDTIVNQAIQSVQQNISFQETVLRPPTRESNKDTNVAQASDESTKGAKRPHTEEVIDRRSEKRRKIEHSSLPTDEVPSFLPKELQFIQSKEPILYDQVCQLRDKTIYEFQSVKDILYDFLKTIKGNENYTINKAEFAKILNIDEPWLLFYHKKDEYKKHGVIGW